MQQTCVFFLDLQQMLLHNRIPQQHGGVLHHTGRALCRVEVVPGARITAARGIDVPRRAVLPQAGGWALGALEGAGVGVPQGADPPVRSPAAGDLSGCGRSRTLRVPGGARARLSRRRGPPTAPHVWALARSSGYTTSISSIVVAKSLRLLVRNRSAPDATAVARCTASAARSL